MNTFCSQNVQTMSELMDLAAVPYHILAPRDGKPMVEIVQDTMVGAFRLTKDWTRIHDKTMANLQMHNSYFKGSLPAPANKKDHHFSGKQAYSQILPPGLFVEVKNKADEKFKIYNSEIVPTSGGIDKNVYHSLTSGIMPILFHDYSPFEVRRFIDNTQRLICSWLMSAGFSVGISDLVTTPETSNTLKDTISTYKGRAYSKLEELRKGLMENDSIFTNEDFFEREILNVLNDLTKQVGSIGLKQIQEKTNRMINMVKSGSKGKETNVAQMIACVGQQNVDGKRVAYGFTDRTLPHYSKYDDGPEARGFVENSFISGLSPQEVFFHAMGGREGLIDTAVKSVTYDTTLVILEDGNPKYVKIGEWIDGHLDNPDNKANVINEPTNNLELLNLQEEVYIPTVDNHGEVSWGILTAVTRHDPGDELYEIKTLSGKQVIVTASKSLLVWKEKHDCFAEVLTPIVQVGDFVPVVAKLIQPPIIIDSVHMSKYFPKTEYLYGTDYHAARAAMTAAQAGRFHIPRGWWEANNGTTFTLPYPSKARFQRALVRSNTENILEGCVYPFHADRECSRMPDTFQLDYENGVFIGLFLADGNTSLPSGCVQITKEEKSVQAFVRRWFDKFGITHRTVDQEREIGHTHGVIGSSTLLCRFLNDFVGETCYHKYVPDVAFFAPEEFVKGILSGYFSGDGSVGQYGITADSVSPRLMEGISMLCNRIGSFGKISIKIQKSNNLNTEKIAPIHHMSIRSHWATKFATKITLINDSKNEQLKAMKCSKNHCNFKAHNDVVLDEIIEINEISPEKYPKMYDVTVPSTLNFVTSSGLGLHDTSETGYIQRRLVKAMEDCKIYYDQTVRNATGAIVQFLYGEDGIEGTKIENQYVQYISMNTLEMDAVFHLRPEDPLNLFLTPEAMETMRQDGANEEKDNIFNRCKEHYDQIVEDRIYLITNVFKGEKTSKIQYAIPFERIIRTAIERIKCVTSDAPVGLAAQTDLTPSHILDTIEDLCKRLKIIREGQGTRFLHLLLRLRLSPKPLIFDMRMTKSVFDWIASEIERYFIVAVAQPGEMVGIVAAQSIGELGTQATLDSFHSSGTAAAVKATSGVPRLKELLSVSKNIKTPTLLIYMKPDIGSVVAPEENDNGIIYDQQRMKDAKKRSMKVMQSLEITRLFDILDGTDIYWDPPGEAGLSTGLDSDKGMMTIYRAFSRATDNGAHHSQSPWVLRLRLNKEKLHRIGLTMMDVYLKLNSYNQTIECLFSDDNAPELVFRIRMTDDVVSDVAQEDAISALKAIEYNLVNNILLKGVKGIKKVSMRSKTREVYNAELDKFEKIAEWVLDTDGTNLQKILSDPNIDAARTCSNDIYEIYQTLGVEAARNALYAEFMEVVGQDSINYRHMSLLLDTMTNRGTLMSVDRHGINRGDVGPLAKSSFEETTDMLINASVFAEYDRINGVSANIMLGQLPPCGTGDHDIMLDEDAYMKIMQTHSKKKHKNIIYSAEDENAEAEQQVFQEGCAVGDLAFSFDMPERQTHVALHKQTVTFV